MDKKQLEDLKLLTGLEDEAILSFALSQAKSRLVTVLNARTLEDGTSPFGEVPKELSYIALEVAVKRIRRLGSEGLASEAVEGHSRTFESVASDFSEYMSDIDAYLESLNPKKDSYKGGLIIW